MISENKDLKEITFNVISKIKYREICLPSNYIEEFNLEIENVKFKEIVSDQISKDLNKSQDLLEKTYSLINSSSKKIESISECNSVENFVREEMSNLLEKINNLSHELHFDELTGAKNRRWLFKEFLDNEKVFKNNGIMVFTDLNDFKGINDIFGHITGDKALIYFVSFLNKRLNKYCKDSFKIIRFAGDEFIILFNEDSNLKKIKNIMRFISLDIEKQKLKSANSNKSKIFKVGFSYGVINFKKGDYFSKTIEFADSNMYEMKAIRKSNRLKKEECTE